VGKEHVHQEGGQAMLELLLGISGAFRPGVLTCLMGVSGAGKTTLMDVLAGRKTCVSLPSHCLRFVFTSGFFVHLQWITGVSCYCTCLFICMHLANQTDSCWAVQSFLR